MSNANLLDEVHKLMTEHQHALAERDWYKNEHVGMRAIIEEQRSIITKLLADRDRHVTARATTDAALRAISHSAGDLNKQVASAHENGPAVDRARQLTAPPKKEVNGMMVQIEKAVDERVITP